MPTLFVGGNHEGSNYLWELYYGGFAAPNIYFMGYSGVVRFGGLRIGGLSGIYKEHDYVKGHFERPPFDRSEVRSAYHVRRYEVAKLLSLACAQEQQASSPQLDIFVSHDWPRGVEPVMRSGWVHE